MGVLRVHEVHMVYTKKSSGPIKDRAWDMYQKDRSVSHLTRKQRDGRYPAENRAMYTKPGRERQVIKMSWSIVSKAADMTLSVILLHSTS